MIRRGRDRGFLHQRTHSRTDIRHTFVDPELDGPSVYQPCCSADYSSSPLPNMVTILRLEVITWWDLSSHKLFSCILKPTKGKSHPCPGLNQSYNEFWLSPRMAPKDASTDCWCIRTLPLTSQKTRACSFHLSSLHFVTSLPVQNSKPAFRSSQLWQSTIRFCRDLPAPIWQLSWSQWYEVGRSNAWIWVMVCLAFVLPVMMMFQGNLMGYSNFSEHHV